MSTSEISQKTQSVKTPSSPSAGRKKKSINRTGSRHQFRRSESESDSDNSDDDSISMSSTQIGIGSGKKTQEKKSRKRHKARQDWEIIEGLKEGQKCEKKPDSYKGYMMKRRRWPLKGWHKRFFSLEKGKLFYAKSPTDIQKGKFHGVIDIGLSVIAFKRHRHRIDIDAEDIVYHVKVKDNRCFEEWIQRLRHHRLYRQHEIAFGTKESPKLTDITSPTDDMAFQSRMPEKVMDNKLGADIIRQSSFKKDSQQSRVATWVMDSAGFEHCDKGLNETQNLLCELRDDLEQLRNIPLTPDSVVEEIESEPSDFTKKKRGLILRKRKDKKSETSLVDNDLRTSSSNPNLVYYEMNRTRPSSMSDAQHSSGTESFLDHSITDIRVRERFVDKAEKVHRNLKSLLNIIGTERDRLKQAVTDNNNCLGRSSASLNKHLIEALRQNAELRSKLAKIHAESAVHEPKPKPPSSPILSTVPPNLDKEREHVLSQSWSTESCSMSEYYDAEEFRDTASESSSEPSDEEDIISSEENDTDYTAVHSVSEDQLSGSFETGRRSALPVPKPDTGDISLWNLLYKNIGKDLSKISMPITLNEPLSMLQRLCEELEYSELVEKACELENPYERMMYIAAFAVSSYASTNFRAGHKPFNPLLGETYEIDRPDKGWRFVAEQVSHHPPISACYCDSKNFIFWQETRIKTKFWGKSMEIQPVGIVNLVLPKWNEQYKWNKVTTCVHNLLGGQRWVDQYGEMKISCGDIVCKITFKKASSWSSKKHEIYGHIYSPEGKAVHNLSGKWTEALYCGQHGTSRLIWRPGAMPDDYELYYGFSRFAIELNELDPDDAKFLPPTDTRFRPDQRLLEEGKIEDAEKAKTRIEHTQRERRKKREEEGIDYSPMWFKQTGKETYEYMGKYWECKKSPGFNKMSFIQLW